MGVKDALLGRLLGSAGSYSQDQVAQTITLLLEHGLKRGASDIHIEPHGNLAWVRYRIHGSLHGLHKLPVGALEPLLSQLKQRAGLVVSGTMPQEAEFGDTVDGKEISIRLNTMPVVGGERVVLHFAQHIPAQPTDLLGLGFWGNNLTLINTTLSRVHGLILVNGPKQSPRPAVLYALLQMLRTASISIATIEETIERRIPGMNQTRVGDHSGAGYIGALHAALKQDINTIMLSNLPTKDVAADAVHAATAGHMIMAGQHHATAAKGLVHLRHMGLEPYMLAAGLRLSIGVRSVRRLCPGCRERVVPATAQLARLEKIFGMATPATRKRVHNLEVQAKAAGLGAEEPLSTTEQHLTHIWRASEDGCEDCHHTGYHGSLPLAEVLPGGEYLYKALADHATAANLQTAALREGFIPLALDGIIKSLRGGTSITEVMHEVGYA